MTSQGAVRALAGGLGVVVGLVGCAIVTALVLVSLGLPAASRAEDSPAPDASPPPPPSVLVVALSLGDPVLQAGIVRDGHIVYARGLEVEVARALAQRLGIPHVRLLYVPPGSRQLTAATRSWDVMLGAFRPSRSESSLADLSDPYLGTDQAVVLRHGLARPSALADLRTRALCAMRGSAAARAIDVGVAPVRRPMLPAKPERLLELIETGVCDAAIVDASSVGRFVAGHGARLGPIAARIAFGDGYVVSVTREGAVTAEQASTALSRMRADGTMHRLARAWLGIDPARLRLLE